MAFCSLSTKRDRRAISAWEGEWKGIRSVLVILANYHFCIMKRGDIRSMELRGGCFSFRL